jgi:hypothetical protein
MKKNITKQNKMVYIVRYLFTDLFPLSVILHLAIWWKSSVLKYYLNKRAYFYCMNTESLEPPEV